MASPAAWSPAPQRLMLAPAEIHLWRARCDEGPEPLHYLELLSPDEKERAGRFAIDGARRDFVVSRGVLRELLAAYLNTRPREIVLRYGVHGKPYVSVDSAEPTLRFNVSHSKGLAIFAFSLEAEVGVDVERIRAEFPGREIAERFFSEQEVAALGKLAPELSSEAFFTCWTRKEAYVKARGGGLQIPLRSFSVGLQEDEDEQIVDESGKEWSIYPFEPGGGFAAAVAAEGRGWRLKYWERRLEGSDGAQGMG
jgi:4'-phosphopantetheinyl transferase